MKESYKEKLGTLSILAQIITADDHIKDEELHFFVRVAKKLNVSEEDYTKVMQGKHAFKPPKQEYKRVVLFHNILLLVYIDKVIDEREIQFCHDLGLKLGLNAAAVENILKKLEEQPQVGIDPFRVDRVFKRYYN